MPLFLRSLYVEVTVNQFSLELDFKVEDFIGETTFVDDTGFNRKQNLLELVFNLRSPQLSSEILPKF